MRQKNRSKALFSDDSAQESIFRFDSKFKLSTAQRDDSGRTSK